MSTLTLEVPDDILKKALATAGTVSPQQVVVTALKEYASRHDQADLVQYFGTSDGFLSPEELNKIREMD